MENSKENVHFYIGSFIKQHLSNKALVASGFSRAFKQDLLESKKKNVANHNSKNL